MPEIWDLDQEVEQAKRWVQELMPLLEEVLARGTKAHRRRFAKYLEERASDLAFCAFSAAGGNADGLPHPDPVLWRTLEENGRLTDTLKLWNQCILYRYWSQMLRQRPAVTLEEWGFEFELPFTEF